MMILGSMERALTSKSVSPMSARQLCQWTAVTSLVTVGALALLSASAVERMMERGRVRVDFNAFKRVAATTVALDRVDEQASISAEDRILKKALFAQAEALPEAETAFTPIQIRAKTLVKSAKKSIAQASANSRFSQITALEANELEQLRRIADPAMESRALAQVYRRLRYQFIAAVENTQSEGVESRSLIASSAFEASSAHLDDVPHAAIAQERNEPVLDISSADENDYGQESVAVAQATDAFEFDSIPVFDAADYEIGGVLAATEENRIEVAAGGADEPQSIDTLSMSASSTMKIQSSDHEPTAPRTLSAFAPVLDDVPAEESAKKVTTHLAARPVERLQSPEESTGPPQAQPNLSDYSKHGSHTVKQATAPAPNRETGLLVSKKPAQALILKKDADKSSEDEREYSRDIASIFEDSDDEDVDFTGSTVIAGGDYSIQSRPKAVVSASTQSVSGQEKKGAQAEYSAGGGQHEVPSIIVRSPSNSKPSVTQHGQGVSQDDKGITIAWSQNIHAKDAQPSSKTRTHHASTGGQIQISKPSVVTAADSISKKFSIGKASLSPTESALKVSQSASVKGATNASPAPRIDLKKCESSRSGVEAFSPSSEKEALSVCARVLSHEGLRSGDQSRWYEIYGIEGEYWPTIAFSKKLEKRMDANRVPLLSSASIRLLSAISRTNTHSGTGIVFGEVQAGMEIQLLGRADAPVYLDNGMNRKSTPSDSGERRQFVLLNVEPGQPLLYVKDAKTGLSGSIALVTKPGMATYVSVPEPKALDLSIVVLNAASHSEARLPKATVNVIGQNNKVGITDRKGEAKIQKVTVFGNFPLYVDAVMSERGYRNRYRIVASQASSRVPLFFFDEKKVGTWIGQLAGGVSPFSGVVVGALHPSLSKGESAKTSSVRIGALEKKSSLIPERYGLGADDRLLPEATLNGETSRFIGVQIPEGPAIPSVIDEKGSLSWSELIYAQPGVINVVGP
jgi:hypothetical protein